jgi:CheY-like chemotaxis protein
MIEHSNNKSIEEPVQPDRFSGIEILVIDDEIDSLNILTLVFEQEGAKVKSAASAREALDIFNESTPDLIISDIGMPEVDGYTLISEIRALPQGKNLPAIALSAYAGEVDRQHSLKAGFQEHLNKPVDIYSLLNVTLQLLKAT